MSDVAVSVGDDLDFDVARIRQERLDVDARVIEVRLTLTDCVLVLRLDLVGAVNDLQAAATATAVGFDRERVTVFVGERPDVVWIRRGFGRPGTIGTSASAMIVRERVFHRSRP